MVVLALVLQLADCTDSTDPNAPSDGSDRAGTQRSVPSLASVVAPVVLVGAGDIASCSTNQGDEKTAAIINGLIASDPGISVFAAGDVVYENGTASEFTNCYAPSWGQFKSRTRPAIGNHEYNVSATPYFNYFGAAAGQAGQGYYSYDLGQWHIIVLNSNSSFVSTSIGSAQDQWLQADLAATGKPCVLAFWHHARFRSTDAGPLDPPYAPVKPFWDRLYAAKADVILVGHQHFYERFAPQTPDGVLDAANGVRQFLVGTGGKSTGPQPTVIAPNSEVRHGGKQEFGVLKLSLGDGTYTWQFIPVAGKTFTDAGSGTCHPKAGGGGTGQLTINAGDGQSAAAGAAVATRPAVKVTGAGGAPTPGVSVTFAIASGGGSVSGASQVTDAGGIATVGGWTLGTLAGPNTLTATSSGLAGSPATFSATATPGAANAGASTAVVPDGVVGSPTAISLQAKDQYGNALTAGGATVVVTVTGANSASPSVTDHGDGTYAATYTPSAAGTDQVAVTLNGPATNGSPYSSTVSAGGGASAIALQTGNNQSAAAGTAVTTAPAVKVTDTGGNPVQGTVVTFSVNGGGGGVTGATQTTGIDGIATVGSWTLGTVAGSNNNTLRATATGLTGSPVTFTASATPGSASAAVSTASVPNGSVGAITQVGVQAKDQYGNALTTGGATVVVTVTGANSASPSVTDHGDGTYGASYTPSSAGIDNVAITLDGTPISGSPYSSTVTAGVATTIALNGGNNQSATVATAVPVPPSVKVTNAGGNPVAGVAVTFQVTVGGGSLTGATQTTDASGIATVGSWTLGTKSGNNKITATAAGLSGSPVTIAATATADVPVSMAVNAGDNQTAPAGTTVPVRPAVKVTDSFGNGVPNVTVTFTVASGGGSVTSAIRQTGSGGIATVGSWKLGPAPGPNTLQATATGAGIANNPVTFAATGS